jgi:hypothetical protein
MGLIVTIIVIICCFAWFERVVRYKVCVRVSKNKGSKHNVVTPTQECYS